MSNALSINNSSMYLFAPGASLEAYMSKVNSFEKLSSVQEQSLARHFLDTGDKASIQKLVLNSLRYVLPVAHLYKGYGLPLAEIIQEGNVGLLKAARKFDPEQKVRFMTFASYWVKAEIHEYVIRNWRIVRTATTKAQRKLFFKLKSAKKAFSWLESEQAEVIAEDLGVKKSDVLEMESRLYGKDIPIALSSEEDDGETALPVLVSKEPSPESLLIKNDEFERRLKLFNRALSGLDGRSQEIVKSRLLREEKRPLRELSEKYHVSMERIRQLEVAALQKIKTTMLNEWG